ncbi:MAG: flagellar hook-associated protein FlgL [Firmicutes bacterium]|nr:flagellar hook-associated protein FlgL [Bacillota bacterium]
MRITNRTMSNNLLLNLQRGMTRLERLNNQLGSKKQINVPSDDPVKAGDILRMRSTVRETEQYVRNTENALSWLDASDIVLKDVLEVIHRSKELANRGASTHLDDTSRKALADEVYQLHDSLLQLANSTHGGRYLFSGQKTQTVPFQISGGDDDQLPEVEYKGDGQEVEFEIGVGINMGVNMKGETLFKPIFDALEGLYGQLTDSVDPEEEQPRPMQDLDNALDGVLRQISELGGKQNRVDLAHERLLDLSINVKKLLSDSEDLDYAEAIMHLKMEEFAYRTALSVGARIIQPSLVDFLR